MTKKHSTALVAAIVIVLALLQPSIPANASVPAAAPAQAPQATVFANRVATFNVCNPCRNVLDPTHHLDQIKDQIIAYRPQVIALQEICVGEARLIQELLALHGYRYNIAYGSVTNRIDRCYPYGRAYGSALLSAAPLTNQVNHRYTVGGSEPRGYLAADTTIAGHQVRVFATHLAQAKHADVRRQQVQEFLEGVLAYPQTIVLGDFNSEPTASELAPMWIWFRDADPACGPTQNRPPCKPTADAAPYRKKFDYIFLRRSGTFTASNNGVHPNYSDHDLVHADLSTE